jgi:hypothetical protein
MAIIRGESIEAYHANSALSKSKIMDYIKRGPAYYKAVWIDRTEKRKESKALWFGQRFDGLCDNADRELATWAPEIPEDAPKRSPEKHRNAKKPSPETLAAFAWWDEWDALHAGKVAVSNEDRFILQQMLTEFRSNPLVARMWERCERQVTIRCELPELGVSLQARPDGVILDPSKPEMADVKTTRGLAHFDKDFFSFGYHAQAAIGQWLLAIEGFDVSNSTVFPVVESCRYPACEVRDAPEGALAHGWAIIKKAVEEIAERTKTNNWRREPQREVKKINVPKWQEIAWENEE